MQSKTQPKAFDLEAEIRKLADRAAITDVVHRYCRGINTNDASLVASCFTADAVLVSGGQTMHGNQAIENFYIEWFRTTSKGGGSAMQRKVSTPYSTNLEITLEGDRARGTSSGLAIHAGTRGDDGCITVRGVFYRDEFVRTENGWRISDRYHGAHWASEFPARLVPH